MKNNENPFNDLHLMDSFALMVFIELSLLAEDEVVSERIHTLIGEARKVLAERNLDADAQFLSWKQMEEIDVTK